MKKEKRRRKPQIPKKDVFGFIIVRLVILTALVISAVIVQFSTSTFLPLTPFYMLVISSFILSGFYFGLYLWGKYYVYQVFLQIIFDLLLITSMVYISGGLEGSFYFLYVFEIIAAGVILSKRASYITAALSAIFFGVLVDGMFLGLIPYFGQVPKSEITQAGILNNLFTAWGVFFIVAFLVNYFMDKLKVANRKLRMAQMELDVKRRLAVVGEVSAHLSHEIRNPLAAISGAVQVLRKELNLNEEQSQLMEIVVKESDRVSESIDQFLSLSADRSPNNTCINLSEMCRETLLLMQKSGEFNGDCSLRGNYRSSDICLYGNSNRYKQIFWNLIKNAVKAMDGYGTLTIDFAKESDRWVQLRFKDTGRGMSDEERQKIFEPFYSSFNKGKGIGMAVVKRIVDECDGKIDVFSELHKGTEVKISMPFNESEESAQLILGDF